MGANCGKGKDDTEDTFGEFFDDMETAGDKATDDVTKTANQTMETATDETNAAAGVVGSEVAGVVDGEESDSDGDLTDGGGLRIDSSAGSSDDSMFESENKKPWNLNARALLIGLNYRKDDNKDNDLSGPENDVRIMEQILVQRFGYDPYSIGTVTDSSITHRRGVMDYLDDFFSDIAVDEHLFLYFSGHGTQITDADNDEIDGNDEGLSLGKDNVITDDVLSTYLSILPEGITVTILIDASSSGTMADLQYHLQGEEQLLEVKSSKEYKAKVVTLSSCCDIGTRREARISAYGGTYGTFTVTLGHLFNKQSLESYNWLKLLKVLKEAMAAEDEKQIPQLCTNDLVQVYQRVAF